MSLFLCQCHTALTALALQYICSIPLCNIIKSHQRQGHTIFHYFFFWWGESSVLRHKATGVKISISYNYLSISWPSARVKVEFEGFKGGWGFFSTIVLEQQNSDSSFSGEGFLRAISVWQLPENCPAHLTL